jgi:hypothetical protein
MNKGQLIRRAIENCLKKETWTMEGDEFNRAWTIPLVFTAKGKQIIIDLCFKAYCTTTSTVYEETVKIYSDKKKETYKSMPTRLYFLKEKFDEESMDELTGMLEGMEQELSFSKGDITKFIKSQAQTTPSDAVVEKRGRGRPRKEKVEEVVATEKRGRGRPRKEPVDTNTLPLVAVSVLE